MPRGMRSGMSAAGAMPSAAACSSACRHWRTTSARGLQRGEGARERGAGRWAVEEASRRRCAQPQHEWPLGLTCGCVSRGAGGCCLDRTSTARRRAGERGVTRRLLPRRMQARNPCLPQGSRRRARLQPRGRGAEGKPHALHQRRQHVAAPACLQERALARALSPQHLCGAARCMAGGRWLAGGGGAVAACCCCLPQPTAWLLCRRGSPPAATAPPASAAHLYEA